MAEIPRIEEPPPIRRTKAPPPMKRGVGRLLEWRREPVPRSEPPSRGAPPGGRGWPIAGGLAVLTLVLLQAWTLHRLASVRTDLSIAGASLDEARASLGLLWETAQRLDADQLSGLAQLTDSIRSVSAYTEGEMRLWETAYYAHEQRLDENASRIAGNGEAIAGATAALRTASARIDELAGSDEGQLLRLAGLEQQGRTQSATIEALSRRTQTQEAALADVSSRLSALRSDFARVDSELLELEEQLAGAGSAYAELDGRVDGVASWVADYRQTGLSAAALERRLATLGDELRRVRMRVDSLRSRSAAVRTSNESR